MGSDVDFQQRNCIMVMASVTFRCRCHGSLHRLSHPEVSFRLSSRYGYYLLQQYGRFDEGCIKWFVGWRVLCDQSFLWFFFDTTTCLFTESSDIYILGVASGIHSKGSNMLRNYPLTRKISVLSFCHCKIGGLTKFACVLVHNIPSSGSVQE